MPEAPTPSDDGFMDNINSPTIQESFTTAKKRKLDNISSSLEHCPPTPPSLMTPTKKRCRTSSLSVLPITCEDLHTHKDSSSLSVAERISSSTEEKPTVSKFYSPSSLSECPRPSIHLNIPCTILTTSLYSNHITIAAPLRSLGCPTRSRSFDMERLSEPYCLRKRLSDPMGGRI